MTVLRCLSVGVALAALLVGSGARADGVRADGYRPDQFLTLDLNQAVLSPVPLGPATAFAPVPVEAQADAKAATATAPPVRTAQVRTVHPQHPAGHRIAQHRGNPLDAQASAPRPRIQLWYSCASGLCTRQR